MIFGYRLTPLLNFINFIPELSGYAICYLKILPIVVSDGNPV
jgi:hypothetical protein